MSNQVWVLIAVQVDTGTHWYWNLKTGQLRRDDEEVFTPGQCSLNKNGGLVVKPKKKRTPDRIK